MKNSAQAQIELQQAMNKLGKLTRSGIRSDAAVKQAEMVVFKARELANIIAVEAVANKR